ncbi:MAG: RrF2 family transcriptional regulator [Christensenellales bacterium]|jgi:Rrf2 family cysteine metabolism transcriptional repressor
MKLSTKSRYGLKACYELALRREQGPVSLVNLVQATGTTVHYLEQIMILLRKGGIVKADRGVSGGYYLTREPDKISVGEILRALEDGLMIIDCIGKECSEKNLCPTHSVWQKMYEALNSMLDGYTLMDMLKNMENKNENLS